MNGVPLSLLHKSVYASKMPTIPVWLDKLAGLPMATLKADSGTIGLAGITSGAGDIDRRLLHWHLPELMRRRFPQGSRNNAHCLLIHAKKLICGKVLIKIVFAQKIYGAR
jgi:hypothetical protein